MQYHLKNRPKSGEKEKIFTDKQRKMNPSSLANLKPWKKGVSGNPAGRPPMNKKFIQALKVYGQSRWVNKLIPQEDNGKTYNQLVIEKIWNKAKVGDLEFILLLCSLDALQPELLENEDETEVELR